MKTSIGCWREHYSIPLSCERAQERRKARALLFAVFLVSNLTSGLLRGQEALEVPKRGEETAPRAEPGAPPPPASQIRPLRILGDELKLYFVDSVALFTAPIRWKKNDWWTAGAVGAGIVGVMAFDERLAGEIQERRSPATDRLSRWTTNLGTTDAFVISGALVAGGVVFKDSNVTSMGREALEASVFTGLMSTVAKRAFGRKRPIDANDQTAFELGSSNQSFPSGHTTEAFTLASVIAARSSGWVVPSLAYTAACLVAYDRLNDRQHFPSDVVAGAALGVAVGRFVVHRHQPQEASPHRVDLQVVPIRNGASLVARF
ncbi:MAG TPA: phosphatase PAP2 family protein [Thermoanaerobaculia bacterium]|nr:phosphatase PAP2 family protein [Thermoanaerobaculia bacterium]